MGMKMGDLFPEASRNGNGNGRPERIASYDYCDEHGVLLFQALRYHPKGFKQRRPVPGSDDWVWNLQGVRRVLYRLPEVRRAIDEGRLIYLVEGPWLARRAVVVKKSLDLGRLRGSGAPSGEGCGLL
jgi:hypothetical protein